MRRSLTPSAQSERSPFSNKGSPSPLTTPLVRRHSRRPKRAAASGKSYRGMGGGRDSDDDGGADESDGFSQEELYDMNAMDVSEGDVMVHRVPILACLNVPPEIVLKRPFKPPIPPGWFMPPEQCGLGAANKGRTSLGTSRASRPPSLLGEYRSVSREELAAAQEEEEVIPGYDPCVLWEGDETTKRVAVSPFVGKFLREHQREGVRFVFECVNGLRGPDPNRQGCILADDMGLGKTLQSITLLHTMLRKGLHGQPTCKRVIVVCPTSLVRNWENEVKKWLQGRVRCIALVEMDKNTCVRTIQRFVAGAWEVMVISYDTFRLNATHFDEEGACDLLICDEAHRLKNDATLTAQALDKLRTKRRILLSGTPMQNDLEEFYAMVNFCNPGVLGTASEFRRRYQTPILAGREPDADEACVKKSAERSAILSDIVNMFILRRTNTLLAKHLPPKLTQIVCVSMTNMQAQMYERVAALAKPDLERTKASSNASGATALNAINALKKICNHPQLMYKTESLYKTGKASGEDKIASELVDFFPPGFGDHHGGGARRSKRGGGDEYFGGANVGSSNLDFSGKFTLIANLLSVLRHETNDRMVIVSNYTQTLDLMEILCKERDYPFVRLDGGSSAKKRQGLVDRLNDPRDDVFVFLLSSKAGGCGLNLIGANRLVLFDPDWNPATDKQAAARIWREGQKKRSYVYRFLSTGTIEEKIYQRQLSKEGLQSVIADDREIDSTLSTAQLKALFTYRHGILSDTHDLYDCKRCQGAQHDKENCSKEIIPEQLLESPSRMAGFAAPRRKPAAGPAAPGAKPEVVPARDYPEHPTPSPQIEYPDEGDLNEWAHHIGASTCEDYALRKAAAMATPDGATVSFVYGQVIDGEGLARQAMLKAAKAALARSAAEASAVLAEQQALAMNESSPMEILSEEKKGSQ